MTGKKIGNALLVTSWDDYDPANMRIAAMLKQYNIPGTFFIQTGGDANMDQIVALAQAGFEIGCHGHSHVPLREVSISEARGDIEIAQGLLRNAIGREVDILAYPRGRFNQEVVQLLKTMGFKEARTTHVLHLGDPSDPMTMPTTVHTYSGRKEYEGRDWLTVAKEYWTRAQATGKSFHLWGHAWEMNRDGEWDHLKEFFDYIHSNEQS